MLSHSYCKLYPFFSLSTAFVQNIKVRKSLRHRLYFLLDYSSSYVSQLFKELKGLSKFRIKSIATSLHLSRILQSAMFSHFHTDHPLSEVVISADLTILRGKFRRSKYRKKVFLFISDPLYERNSPSGVHYTDYTLFHTTLHMSTTIKKFQSMCFSSFICLQNCLQISWLLQRSCY